jgi:hypothetical protein
MNSTLEADLFLTLARVEKKLDELLRLRLQQNQSQVGIPMEMTQRLDSFGQVCPLCQRAAVNDVITSEDGETEIVVRRCGCIPKAQTL